MKILSNFLTALGIMLWLVTCSVSKEGRIIKKAINGNWVLQTITTEGVTGALKTKIFNEVDFSCFIGSEWNFVARNGSGSYSIVDPTKECAPNKRFIHWSINETNDGGREFQVKRLDDKKDPMDNGNGFTLAITQLDQSQMKLRTNISYEGHPAAMIYNFVKK